MRQIFYLVSDWGELSKVWEVLRHLIFQLNTRESRRVLSDLKDVSKDAPMGGNVLQYDEPSKLWKPGSLQNVLPSDVIDSATNDTDQTLTNNVETVVITNTITWNSSTSKKLVHFMVHWTVNTVIGTRSDMRVRVYRDSTIIYEQTTLQPSSLSATVTNKDACVIDDSSASAGARVYTIRLTHIPIGTGSAVAVATWMSLIGDERG